MIPSRSSVFVASRASGHRHAADWNRKLKAAVVRFLQHRPALIGVIADPTRYDGRGRAKYRLVGSYFGLNLGKMKL